MKRFLGCFFCLAGALALGAPTALANENMGCYGVSEVLGPQFAGLYNASNGKLRLSKLFGGNPNIDLRDQPNRQRIALSVGSLNLPHGAPLEAKQITDLEYSNGRLEEISSKTVEAQNPDRVIFGKRYSYEWSNGKCLTTRITVKNRPALGEATGVFFDKNLCLSLKDKHVLDPARIGACVKSMADTLKYIHDFDEKLRKQDKGEFLVTANPFLPNMLVPVKGSIEGNTTLGLMAACADYFSAEKEQADSVQEDAPADFARPGR